MNKGLDYTQELINLNMDFARIFMPDATNDLVRLAALHKARYEKTNISKKLRLESRYWLQKNGFKRLGGMDFQHKKIKGYRDLSEEEIKLINKVKEKGKELGELVNELRGLESTDKRWVSIGATDFQTGLMALTRSIAKPDFF